MISLLSLSDWKLLDCRRLVCWSLLTICAGSQLSAVDYLREVKPLLRQRCFACHGALKQESSLRLDTVASMIKGGDSGPVISPAAPAESLLLQRLTATDSDQRMPPEQDGEPLTTAQIELLRAWISAGAPGARMNNRTRIPAITGRFGRSFGRPFPTAIRRGPRIRLTLFCIDSISNSG